MRGSSMCLPGTVEAVREQQPTITRRTVLAGGGAAALAALMPGEALAHRRGRGHGRHQWPRQGGGPDARRSRPGSRSTRETRPRADADDDPRERVLQAGVDLRRALRDAHGRPGPLRGRWPLHAAARGERARAAARGDRHRQAGAVRPRHSGRRRRSQALRAPLRADPDGALVAMDSGWAKKIANEAAYKGGPAGAYHFPGFGDEAIESCSSGGRRRRSASTR